jgi:hypothetical protein
MGLKIGKFLGGVARGVIGTALRLNPVAGAVVSAGQRLLQGRTPFAPFQQPIGSTGFNLSPMGILPNAPMFPGFAPPQLPQGPMSNPQRPNLPVPYGGGVMSPLGTMAKVPAGYHVNKALIRAQVSPTPGNLRRAAQVVHDIVKNRHINPLNPYALRRADRRARGFLKSVRHMVKYYQPKKPKGKAYISTKRRAR